MNRYSRWALTLEEVELIKPIFERERDQYVEMSKIMARSGAKNPESYLKLEFDAKIVTFNRVIKSFEQHDQIILNDRDTSTFVNTLRAEKHVLDLRMNAVGLNEAESLVYIIVSSLGKEGEKYGK